jgi:hypothetical protein
VVLGLEAEECKNCAGKVGLDLDWEELLDVLRNPIGNVEEFHPELEDELADVLVNTGGANVDVVGDTDPGVGACFLRKVSESPAMLEVSLGGVCVCPSTTAFLTMLSKELKERGSARGAGAASAGPGAEAEAEAEMGETAVNGTGGGGEMADCTSASVSFASLSE